MTRLFLRAVLVVVAIFVVIQFVPYGRAHENPPAREGVRKGA